MKRKDYSISGNISGYDVKDILYTKKFSKTILIVPEPRQVPSIKKSVNARIYLKDYAMVSVSLKNNANYNLKNVSITDALPDGFKLVGNHSLHWVVDIPAKGEWDYRYLIKPLQANKNGVVLPAAIAEFLIKKEYHVIQSNTPEIVVHGPRVILNKQTDVSEIHPGGAVTVTIVAENIGSTPTKVFIRDKLPEVATIVSGSTVYEKYLEANRAVSFSYTIRINSEHAVKLPPATVEYFELGTKGGEITAMSKEIEITIKSQNETSGAVQIKEPPASEDSSVDSGTGNASEEPEKYENGADRPVIDEPGVESVDVPAGEIYAVLKAILNCNEPGNNSSHPDAYDICSFFRLNRTAG